MLGGPLAGLRVYDPCCGSGTVLLAATALGAAAVAGSDLRSEFVDGCRSNLEGMGVDVAGTPLFVHDATQTLPDGALPPRHDGGGAMGGRAAGADAAGDARPWCDVLVSNPPWGKNLGKHEDGGPIVLSLCRQFRGVTMVLLVNKLTRAALEGAGELCTVRKVIKLGGVEAVLLST